MLTVWATYFATSTQTHVSYKREQKKIMWTSQVW